MVVEEGVIVGLRLEKKWFRLEVKVDITPVSLRVSSPIHSNQNQKSSLLYTSIIEAKLPLDKILILCYAIYNQG